MSNGEDGLVEGGDGTARCWWCAETEGYRRYHDREWGRPVRSDRRLFEKICLEGFQAGLSWRTVLEKREAFRRAFDNFHIDRVAAYGETDVERLLDNESIIRHRAKIESAIRNARRARDLVDDCGSLASFVWQFEPAPRQRPSRMTRDYFESHIESHASRRLASSLEERGWTYIGPTNMHSFLRSVGVINAHLDGCEFRSVCRQERATFDRPPAPT